MEIHIGKNKTECVVPAGYLNRAARRRWRKIMKRDRKEKGVRIL